MSGKIKQKNFNDNIEIGKTYLKDFSGDKVTIISKNNKYFVGDDKLEYTPYGRYAVSSRKNKKAEELNTNKILIGNLVDIVTI